MRQQPKEIVDLFLCHNSADKPWVETLAEQIESETFDGSDTGRPLRVFFDAWDIDVAQNIVLRINEAMKVARYFAVVISPEMLGAPWTAFEWTDIVASDPTNRAGRLIPLFYRDFSEAMQKRAELPAPFRTLNWIDFRRKADFRKSYQKLIRKLRDQPPVRGRKRRPLAAIPTGMTVPGPVDDTAAAPDRIADLVLGNLLAVVSFPTTVWSAPTSARLWKDVWDKVADASPFILEGKRLYTFADLSGEEEPLRDVISTDAIESHAVARWKDDPVRWRVTVHTPGRSEGASCRWRWASTAAVR